MTLYRVLVCGESQAKDCVSKIMVATMTKSVELHYSGTGRVVKNVGKKNFSATTTYSCLKGLKYSISNIFYQILCYLIIRISLFLLQIRSWRNLETAAMR